MFWAPPKVQMEQSQKDVLKEVGLWTFTSIPCFNAVDPLLILYGSIITFFMDPILKPYMDPF